VRKTIIMQQIVRRFPITDDEVIPFFGTFQLDILKKLFQRMGFGQTIPRNLNKSLPGNIRKNTIDLYFPVGIVFNLLKNSPKTHKIQNILFVWINRLAGKGVPIGENLDAFIPFFKI